MISETKIEKLKSQVKDAVYNKDSLTIDEICKELDYDNDFKVGCIVGRLENEGKIISNGEKIAYDPDGRGILIGTYEPRGNKNA